MQSRAGARAEIPLSTHITAPRPQPESPSRAPERTSAIVTRLERLEAERRRRDAEGIALIAEAMHLAERAAARTGNAPDIHIRSLRAELAMALGLSEYQVDRRLGLAYTISENYPQTWATLEHGEISLEHAQVVVDAGLVLGSDTDTAAQGRRAGYERRVLEVAVRETPGRLRPIARRIAEQFAEVSLEERHRAERQRAYVAVTDAEDGMAFLTAYLDAPTAYAVHDRLTRMARTAQKAEGRGVSFVPVADSGTEAGAEADVDGDVQNALMPSGESATSSGDAPVRRSIGVLRSDILADLLLAGTTESAIADGTPSIIGKINVIVPAQCLPAQRMGDIAGDDATVDQPPLSVFADSAVSPESAESPGSTAGNGNIEMPVLAGYGPIPPPQAAALARAARSWHRTHIDPECGTVVAVDRYRPSEEQRRLLAARDEHCRFPGCRVPVSRCDLDHTIDAARGGPTSTDNLAHLCRGHHTLKHSGAGWEVTQRPDGDLVWTSPTGRVYFDRRNGRYFAKLELDIPPGDCSDFF